MAIDDAYADNDTYKAVIGTDVGEDDSQIDDQLLAMSRVLESKVGQFFTKDDAVQNRIYYPEGYYSGDPDSENPWIGVARSRFLNLRKERCPGIATTSGVVIKIDTDRDGSFSDETALASTDYELHPLNAALGPEPRPWTKIYLPEWSTVTGFPAGCRIQVTARFGWPTVPKAIVEATCQLVALYRLETPRATNRLSEGIDMMIGTSKAAQDILTSLMRAYEIPRWVIA